MLSLQLFAGLVFLLLMLVWVLALGVVFFGKCWAAQSQAHVSQAEHSSGSMGNISTEVSVAVCDGDEPSSSDALAA